VLWWGIIFKNEEMKIIGTKKPFTEKEFLLRNAQSQKEIKEHKLVSHKDVKLKYATKK
jgi:hypothetical protein